MGIDRLRSSTGLRVYAAAMAAVLLLTIVAMSKARRGQDAVVNGSAQNSLSDWRVACSDDNLSLGRVPVDGPHGVETAVEVRHPGGEREWCMALAVLREPQSFFERGRTYRMRAYVRDVEASGRSTGIVLANDNFTHRPTEAQQYGSYRDDSWHLLQRTFVATSTAHPDTALYVDLPTEGPMHWQITLASVREVELPEPESVGSKGPTTQLSFDGPEGSPPDHRVWRHEVGGDGWGNGEVQSYTDRTANSQLDGQGSLVLTARREDVTGPDGIARQYSSARLTTLGRLSIAPGSYVEARIRVPTGRGVRPAFWMLGTDLPEVGWPACGELDVMEASQRSVSTVRHHIHFSSPSDPSRDLPYGENAPAGYTTLDGPRYKDFHLYGVYFDGEVVQFYVDRQPRLRLTRVEARERGRSWPFGKPQFMLLNIALGQNLGDVQFPVTMTVSDISIWQGGVPSA
jgi:hypothetical protein